MQSPSMQSFSTETLRRHPGTRGLDIHMKPWGQYEMTFPVGGHGVGPTESPPWGLMVCCSRWWRGLSLWLAAAVASQGLPLRASHWVLRFGWLGQTQGFCTGANSSFLSKKAEYEVQQSKYFGNLWPFRQEIHISFSILERMSRCNYWSLKYLLDHAVQLKYKI